MVFALRFTLIGLILVCVACSGTGKALVLYVSCDDPSVDDCSNGITSFDPQTMETRTYDVGEIGYPLAPSSTFGTVTYVSKDGLKALNLESGMSDFLDWGVLGATSPDGRFLVYGKQADIGYNLFLYDYQFRQLRELLNDRVGGFAWSPDSTTVVVFNSEAEDVRIVNIFSGEQQVIRNLSGNVLATPAWSKDGKRIAYSGSYNGTLQLFVMDLDGYIQRITSDMNNAVDPMWVSDNAVVFAEIGEVDNDTLYIVDLQTLNIEALFVANHLLGLNESPDAQKIALIDSDSDFKKRLCIVTISDRTHQCYTDIPTIGKSAIPAWIELD